MNVKFFSWPLAALFVCSVILFAGDPVLAQETPEPPGVSPSDVEEEDGDDEDDLELTVRPEDQPAPTPVEAPVDLSLSYPSLSDQIIGRPGPFGAASGVLRNNKSLFDTPAAIDILPRRRIIEKQSSDMFEALQGEVGVHMQRTAAGQSSPFVRGLTGQQVLILIDGVRLNNSIFRFGPNQYFNTIDPGMIDQVEVLRGQGSVLWGSDAIGGTINIVTRSPDMYGNYHGHSFTQYYNTASSESYSRANIEGWVGPAGVFGGGSFLNVRNLDTGFDFGRQPGTNYQQYAGDIKFRYLVHPDALLTVALQHHVQDSLPRSDRFPGFPADRNNSNTPGNARFFDPQQRDLAYLRYEVIEPNHWMDLFSFTASYHRQRDIQTRGIPTTRFQETDVDTVGMNAVAVKELSPRWGRLTTGADWYYDDVDSAFGGTASGPIIPDDAWYRRIGWFTNWDVELNSRLDFTAGVRYENIALAATPIIEVGGVDTPTPISPGYEGWVTQMGLVYELNPCVHLVGSISEGFRAPNLDELTANNPNVQQQGMDVPTLGLRPEESIAYEVGVKTNFDHLRTQTFVYWIDLDGNIVPRETANQFTFGRANQDSFIQGVEFDGEYLLTGGWSIWGNFWYTFGKNQVTKAPISRIPPTQGNLGIRWRDPQLRGYFELYAWMVRDQDRLDPVRDDTDERIPIGGTPGYTTLNARWGKTFGCCDQHRVSLSLENITDEAYRIHGSGVFGTGATATFGYSYVR